MDNKVLILIVLIAGLAVGIFMFIKALKKHKRIDTESIAIVKEIQYLGRDDGNKVYGIKYSVMCSTPYEFWVTPTRRLVKVGKERVVFFESSDPKKNYFFKKLGRFDTRFIMPSFLIIGCISSIVLTICSIL